MLRGPDLPHPSSPEEAFEAIAASNQGSGPELHGAASLHRVNALGACNLAFCHYTPLHGSEKPIQIRAVGLGSRHDRPCLGQGPGSVPAKSEAHDARPRDRRHGAHHRRSARRFVQPGRGRRRLSGRRC
ncbi:Hypothetical protein A7982_11927 [Minicystis rosea]|nr:Hypothetical protein A7982_11927 [Minicystis rosea]